MAKSGKQSNNNSKPKRVLKQQMKRRGGIRANADRALGQGVGRVTKKAFGDKAQKAGKRYTLACWDAKLPMHLALPRAVGPYTTIRTTVRFQSASMALCFGAFWDTKASNWTNTACYNAVNAGNPINAANNTQTITYNLDGLGPATTLVPSACTVQVMNPNPLQATTGICYAGVSNAQFAFDGDTSRYDDRWSQFVQFQDPRILSAGKLALRGVQMSSYPLNMSRVSEFAPLTSEPNALITWDSTAPTLSGWAPIAMYNPSAIPLEYLVTMEWRVRFDISNPAAAGHTHHPVSTDSQWDDLMRQAASKGNGCLDIVEEVANHG